MRIQLDIDEGGSQLLERLKEQTGLRTHKDLFNNSITILDWAVRQRLSGRIVASLDEATQSYREFDMPALSYAASVRQASPEPDKRRMPAAAAVPAAVSRFAATVEKKSRG